MGLSANRLAHFCRMGTILPAVILALTPAAMAAAAGDITISEANKYAYGAYGVGPA